MILKTVNKALKRLHSTPAKIIIFVLSIAAGDAKCRIAKSALSLIYSLQSTIMVSSYQSKDPNVFPAVFRFPGNSMYVKY